MVWLLIFYIYLYIHRPWEIWPSLTDLRIETFAMATILPAWLILPNKRPLTHSLAMAFLAFTGGVCVTSLASPAGTGRLTSALLSIVAGYQPDPNPVLEHYFKALIFAVILATSLRTERELRTFVAGVLGAMAVFISHSLWEFHNGRYDYQMDTVRLVGVNTTYFHPNDIGSLVLYTLPLVLPLWVTFPSRLPRCVLSVYCLLSICCIILTASRSSLLGLGLLILIVLYQTRRFRTGLVLLVVSLPLLWLLLPSDLAQRYGTLFDSDAGPASAKASAEGRVQGLVTGAHLFMDNPLTGIGPGAWREVTRQQSESHNLYGQLIGEMGLVGIVCFAFVLLAYRRTLKRISIAGRDDPGSVSPFLLWVGRALGATVILLLFEGAGGHNLFNPFWLWFGSLAACCAQCIPEGVATGSAAETPLAI